MPYGQTTTYGQLATELNCKSAQAIGSAVGKNPPIDIKTNPPKVSFLKELLENSNLDLKKFFNTLGNSYRELDLKDKFDTLTVDEALELLSQDGMLIKRPILVKGDKVLQIGYRSPYEALDLS
ncbi:Spx/MgsR family RNA polymerase-binding regulatory protein [Streptococcus hyovaginalis]|uniref:Spx/MgsR family RNA polymerase-binding regulatory protein n=1 Tax=Streptococcus hyovaginalis TaxID=149015 RepID=UPI003B3AC0EB